MSNQNEPQSVEEAAESYSNDKNGFLNERHNDYEHSKVDFIAGSKWQSTQQNAEVERLRKTLDAIFNNSDHEILGSFREHVEALIIINKLAQNALNEKTK